MKKAKLTKAQKALREEYLTARNSTGMTEQDKQAVYVKVNLAGGLQKIGLGGTINE